MWNARTSAVLDERGSFESLPFDVLLAICRHVDLLSRSQGSSPAMNAKEKVIVGRRVVDTDAMANAAAAAAKNGRASVRTVDPLLAFSSVNKRIRDIAEPVLFECVAFGNKWERKGGERRWLIAQERMLGMIKKSSLRTFVKRFRFWAPTLVWDADQQPQGQESIRQFWTLFMRLLGHLRSVHIVELALAANHQGFYGNLHPLDILPRAPNASSETGSVQRHRDDAGSIGMGELLFGCLPFLDQRAKHYELEENNALLPTSSSATERNRMRFRNIKAVRITRSFQWFIKHCPDLEGYIDSEGTHQITLLAHEFPQTWYSTLKSLRLRELATVHLLPELANYRNLEALGLEALVLDIQDINTIAKSFGHFPRLKSLEITRLLSTDRSWRINDQYSRSLEDLVGALGRECRTLRELKLGVFQFSRTDAENTFVVCKSL